MTQTIEEILTPKPEARLRIYAYSIADKAHKGLLKIGQTTRNVKQRVAEQLKTAAIKNYKIELDEPADRDGRAAHAGGGQAGGVHRVRRQLARDARHAAAHGPLCRSHQEDRCRLLHSVV